MFVCASVFILNIKNPFKHYTHVILDTKKEERAWENLFMLKCRSKCYTNVTIKYYGCNLFKQG